MEFRRVFLSGLCATALVATSGCVTDPNTGHKKVSRTAIGVGVGIAAGVLVGGVVAGGAGRIIGAGIFGVAGASIGYMYDKQIKELKEKTAGSGVAVTPVDDRQAILLSLPSGVTFDPASADINPAFRDTLDKVAANLINFPNSLVDVYGHADSSGDGTSNQSLSEDRARAVADYLIYKGVAASRVRATGFGSSQPIASNETAEGRSANRRVEIKIVPISREDVERAQGIQNDRP